MRVLAAIVFILTACAPARADDLPAAGGLSVPGHTESHGWIALPLTDPPGAAAIVHLPPRRAVDRADTVDDAPDGSVRLALRLPRMPERLAAWGEQLWIAFAPEAGKGGGRRVLTMTVERSALGGAWSSPESDGRLPSLPQLPGDKVLEGFVGSAAGPVALLRDPRTSQLSLLALRGGKWVALSLPAAMTGAGGTKPAMSAVASLVCDADGVGLVSTGTGEFWRGRLPERDFGRESTSAAVQWTVTPLTYRTRDGISTPKVDGPIARSGGQLVFASAGAGRSVDLWSPDSIACRRLAVVEGVTASRALVPLDQLGRVALVWLVPSENKEPTKGLGGGPPKSSAAGFTTYIAEVSALTGAVLYEGPAGVAGPVSAAELKLLAVVLVGVMLVVLLFVLRPDESGRALSLPAGYALAEPGRRVVAGAIDLFLAVALAAAVLGVPVRELVSPGLILYDPAGLQTLLLVLGLGVLHASVGEWLLGVSIGKLVTRCRVVRIVVPPGSDATPIARGPGLWGAFVRNLIRWMLAPVAISGLNGQDHRHRGDLAAGTVVVIRIGPEP